MTCPLCQNPSTDDFSPFCSKTCKSRDLLNWLDEKYRAPTNEPLTEEGETDEEAG